ncbi:MAG: mechanosensitive ion channel [Ignavibacteria bacterium]|nr:mechanosensitive ion channel [Ignavibacteria bacterium]
MKIQEISLRTAIAISRDDKVLIIPNHKFIEDNVTNWTHNNTPTLFKLEVSVDYSSDVRFVEKILLDCAKNNDDVLDDDLYYPLIRFSDFGDSALLFTIIFWSNNLLRIEGTKSNLRFDIFKELAKNNIVIPFPQRVIHKANAMSKDE